MVKPAYADIMRESEGMKTVRAGQNTAPLGKGSAANGKNEKNTLDPLQNNALQENPEVSSYCIEYFI